MGGRGSGRPLGPPKGPRGPVCEHADKRRERGQRLISDARVLEAYLEAVDRIDEITPHYASQFDRTRIAHGIPAPADLEEMAVIENAVNPYLPDGLALDMTRLYRMMASGGHG